MIRIVFSLTGLVCVPILALLAWNRWARVLRRELPGWRNGICIAALLLLSLHWTAVAALETSTLVAPHMQQLTSFMDAMLSISHGLSVAIVALAIALRGAARMETLIGALLMLFCWPAAYV